MRKQTFLRRKLLSGQNARDRMLRTTDCWEIPTDPQSSPSSHHLSGQPPSHGKQQGEAATHGPWVATYEGLAATEQFGGSSEYGIRMHM